MFRRGRKPHQRGGLTSLIDEGSEIEGKCTFSGTVMLNGKFKGEIATNETLIVGEKAVINADIRAGQVLISGEVVGSVRATERVELKPTARVFGDLEAPIVVVEEGVLFEGHCRMTKANQIAEVPARELSVVPLKR
jgi:cytoskeletal protein CcmA (bactofilin family)